MIYCRGISRVFIDEFKRSAAGALNHANREQANLSGVRLSCANPGEADLFQADPRSADPAGAVDGWPGMFLFDVGAM